MHMQSSKVRTQSPERNISLLKESPISFWIDSSGGPRHLCNKSFSGTDPKYYFYGSINEVNFVDCSRDTTGEHLYNMNCFNFLEGKIEEEKRNKDGIFIGYFSYDLSDFFFAYFDRCHSRGSENLDLTSREKQNLDSHFHGNDIQLCSNMTDSEYLEKVRLIKEEIRKGNVYQVNLTREYSIDVQDIDKLDLYLQLRTASPNPYGCYFKTPFVTILSSSPEEFLFVKDRYIRTRPIKGTLPSDVFEIDPKNKAENIMIVDLERNDLGRICEYGSITAKRLLDIESYKHLNHVVSTIEGKLKPGIRLREVFEATFPGGSITGAPKIAAMKLIDKVEPTKRGAYPALLVI